MKVILSEDKHNGNSACISICLTINEVSGFSNIEWKCPISDCTKHFTRQSLLVRHIRIDNTHLEFKNPTKLLYYCPAEGCIYALHNNKSLAFQKLKYLRQHYTKVHCPKDFICTKCQKSFGSQTYLTAHGRSCGTLFECSCKSTFTSLESLQTHARRKNHNFDLHKYQEIINSAKLNQTEKSQQSKPDSESNRTLINIPKEVTNNIFPKAPVPILPKPGPEVRIAIFKIKSSTSIDFGTQTVPILGRKRIATQHCQTESKPTNTRGTLTLNPPSMSNQSKRETFAQTNTLKICAETQTPVVSRRKRCTKKKQITTVTTQTVHEGSIHLNGRSPLQAIDLSTTNNLSEFPGILQSFDEGNNMTTMTQTDPNPFFGWSSNYFSINSNGDLQDKETDESNEMCDFRTSETQTSPSRKFYRLGNSTMMDFSQIYQQQQRLEKNYTVESNSVTGTPSPATDLEDFGSYLETQDSETQTYFFEMEGLNELLP